MFAPFDEKKAGVVLEEIISNLKDGSIKLIRQARLSDERDTSLVMAGVLVCKKLSTCTEPVYNTAENIAENSFNDREIVLITVSGISCRLEGNLPGIFVEPVVSQNQINMALEQNDRLIHELTDKIKELENKNTQQQSSTDKKSINNTDFDAKQDSSLTFQIKALKKQRTSLCDESLNKVFNEYEFTRFDGTNIKMMNYINRLPPTGTGDCCAPKLLSYAFKHSLTPVSMAETKLHFVLKEKVAEISFPKKISFFTPCDSRCSLILPHILGLEIIYRDEEIIVVNKQSGLLSVPGRGPDKQDCIVNRLRRLFPDCIQQPSVHRLDMETSGLLVLAFTKESHRELNRQFENKEVSKKYVALIDGILAKKGIQQHGKMELYFRLDVDNRPHQIWDNVNGKKAVTEWNIENVEYYTGPDKKRRPVTRVSFIPHTGRTHQLRLAASDIHGFGLPIVGDSLYGKCDKGERLMLHATDLSFTHPVTQKKMSFHSESPF